MQASCRGFVSGFYKAPFSVLDRFIRVLEGFGVWGLGFRA